MNRIWLITDTHFGHDNMVKYCGRPENHSLIILQNLKEVVRDGDMIIHLGDFCIGNDEMWHERFFLGIKNVTCVLIRGNHDHKSDNWYLEHGWDFVCDSFSNVYFGKKIIFSHEPVKMKNSYSHINIHGHFHNNLERLLRKEWVVEGEKERNENWLKWYDQKKNKLLAIEHTNYNPVLLCKFI